MSLRRWTNEEAILACEIGVVVLAVALVGCIVWGLVAVDARKDRSLRSCFEYGANPIDCTCWIRGRLCEEGGRDHGRP